jgi:hypothetical protein
MHRPHLSFFTEERNRALQVRLLDSARAKLKQAIDAMPSCAHLYRSVGTKTTSLRALHQAFVSH